MNKTKERIVGLESPEEDVVDVRKKNKFGLQWPLGNKSDAKEEKKKKKELEGENNSKDSDELPIIVKPLNFETHTTTTQSGIYLLIFTLQSKKINFSFPL